MIPLIQIPREERLDKDTFKELYLEPEIPIVITDMMDDWSAKEKWTLDYFKQTYGRLEVSVFSSKSSRAGKKYMQPDETMLFANYIEAIQGGEEDLRLFLFNIFEHFPELKKDYEVPHIMDGFYREFPFAFFGSAGSKVPMHYDIDLSHVFLSQFEGRKRVVLFRPEQSKNLYHLPFTVASYIDVDHPDFEKYPALRNVEGYECILEPGETLYIPSGYWHYITYLDAGFSISQRASDSVIDQVVGAVNIATHFVVDRGMNRLFGERWREIKEDVAVWRAERELTSTL